MPLAQPAYTIGRYDVAGHLATGGMAEILLGRLVGPAGFERPVVIKRILPHLAREASFVAMFLDEARLAAGIRHPNVVQVHELIHDEHELCIVMQYLEGESLFGLMRRLVREGRTLDASLSAHVIAEAAAGLHAAHESVDPDGTPIGLVHRDVSPQNIFVGYNGAITVLDFGIAVVHDRETRTRTGHLRGKYEYMSPEQCSSRRLDRRSDVFSLGAVLYELSTGHRLFKRPNELLVLKAIVEEPLPLPTSVCPGYPQALEQVVLRALEKRRADRYQTAADLRRALLSVLPVLGAVRPADEALAELMRNLFADRIEEKRELLRRLSVGSTLTSVPVAEADAAIELPTVHDPLPPATGDTADDTVAAPPPTPAFVTDGAARPRRKRSAIVALGVLLTVGAITVAVRPVSRSTPLRAALVSGSASTPSARPTPARAFPSSVSVAVESVPPGAEVYVAGTARGTTPLSLDLPREASPLPVKLVRDGYRTLEEQLIPDVDQRLHLVLTPLQAGSTSAAPTRPARVPTPTPAATARKYRRFN